MGKQARTGVQTQPPVLPWRSNKHRAQKRRGERVGMSSAYVERSEQRQRRRKQFCRTCRRCWGQSYLKYRHNPGVFSRLPEHCQGCKSTDITTLPLQAHLPPPNASPGRWKQFYRCFPFLRPEA